MPAGLPPSPRSPRIARLRRAAGTGLKRAVRLGLMLGPLLFGPLAASAAAADLGVGEPAAPESALGPLSWSASGAGFAGGWADEATPPALVALTAPRPVPRASEPSATIDLDWMSGAGLAVHPVRSVRRTALAAGPRLPTPVPSVRPVDGVPALSVPEPLPAFAALLPAGEPMGVEPPSRRLPLIAGRPASPAARLARRTQATRITSRRLEPAPGSIDALRRFLSLTKPGVWGELEPSRSAPARARTAGANDTDGPLRR